MLRESLRRSLEDHDFDVVGEASDGEEAVRLAVELQPDIVLMDVTMPVTDGIEATRLIREQVPVTRVVMLTMHSDRDVITKAVRAGASVEQDAQMRAAKLLGVFLQRPRGARPQLAHARSAAT